MPDEEGRLLIVTGAAAADVHELPPLVRSRPGSQRASGMR